MVERSALVLDLEEVAPFVTRHVRRASGYETVPLQAAVGRVLAADIFAPMDLPPFDQSAVDGYGLPAHLLVSIDRRLPVVGVAREGGSAPAEAIGAVRLRTGAPVPASVAAVARNDDVERIRGVIRIGDSVRPGANIRRRGEDVARGNTVLRSGTHLDVRHLALLAALGFPSIDVRRRLTAAIVTFGEEPTALGAAGRPRPVFDANPPMAEAFFNCHGIDVVGTQIVPDSADAVRDVLSRLAGRVDLIVTSGGTPSGDAAHTRAAIEAFGGQCFSMGIRMKPGKPSSFAVLDGTSILGLPGNPFAALVALVVVGRPAIAALDGSDRTLRPLPAVAAFDLARGSGRAEFFPARRVAGSTDDLAIDRLDKGGSARLRPLVEADGLGLIDAPRTKVSQGDRVCFIPFGNVL